MKKHVITFFTFVKSKRKNIIIFSVGILLLIGLLFGYGLIKHQSVRQLIKIKRHPVQQLLKPEEAKNRAEKFINENLLPPEMKVIIKSIVEEGDVYSIKLDIKGQEYTSYMTKDGKKFFQSGIDIEQMIKETQANKAGKTDKQPSANLSKTDKPEVELFIMSHCPYGTQIEKGILPVIETLGDKINFTLKFCDYAMHGKKELDEQLTQCCIQKEEKTKLNNYLKCFLQSSDSASCLKSASLNQDKINNCIKTMDKQYKVTEKFNDKKTWASGNYPPFDVYKSDNEKYGIQGSPALVVNGEQAQTKRDAASLLTTICSAFNNPPAECKEQLSSTSPSPGFGEGASSDLDASCNN
ncbi:hypothetical protein KKH16_01415 [Patescibacteria group bacterium]|nr:hypothetical protein [Patescibacteria group bacterium]MBU1870923.1 hypothetical protein [Patescibacteria group bacterium]